MVAENGYSHFQSLYHFASPLVLLAWAGGRWVGVWWNSRRSWTIGTEGEAMNTILTKMNVAMIVYKRVLCGGGAGLGYALLEKEGLRWYREGAGFIFS